jgi:peroxiredoxin
MNTNKLVPGSRFPSMTLPSVAGEDITLGGVEDTSEQWHLVVVYRGKHCPICKRYLTTLEELLPELNQAGIEVVAVSGDGMSKAKTFAEEGGYSFPIVYDLAVPQMEDLGLYVSDPRSPQETDRPFPEPGLFAVRPDGSVQIVDISNAPFSRPDLKSILNGIKFIKDKDYPIRGTH